MRETIEKAREELHRVIAQSDYNLTDSNVVEKSQKLDKLLNEEMDNITC